MTPSVRLIKRLLDVAAASTGIVLTAPLMAGIALAVRGTSRGSALYRQRRAGMITGDEGVHFEEFWLYKFRTMVQDAEGITGVVLAEKGDPRITRLGLVLRRTRLDELPQFFNILKGEMSLVGPRPERPELIRNLSLAIPFFEERMRLIKPGLTGLAQISLGYSGRMDKDSELGKLRDTLLNPFDLAGTEDSTADDMRTKMLYDFVYSAYLESFWQFLRTDLSVVLKTPIIMFLARTGQ